VIARPLLPAVRVLRGRDSVSDPELLGCGSTREVAPAVHELSPRAWPGTEADAEFKRLVEDVGGTGTPQVGRDRARDIVLHPKKKPRS
jgi:hypothetical protein